MKQKSKACYAFKVSALADTERMDACPFVPPSAFSLCTNRDIQQSTRTVVTWRVHKL